MRRDKSGTPLRKSLTIRIVLNIGLASRKFTHTYRAPAGQGFTPKGIDDLLEMVADNIDKRYSGLPFRLVSLDDGSYSFIHDQITLDRHVAETVHAS